jgi:hypothetical protein
LTAEITRYPAGALMGASPSGSLAMVPVAQARNPQMPRIHGVTILLIVYVV